MQETRSKKRPLCAFQQTMHEITETFQTVSQAIIKLSKDLRTAGFVESATLIEQLQDQEQAKLKLVRKLVISVRIIVFFFPLSRTEFP